MHEGNSFEAGNSSIEKTGAKVICLSWLKTINSDYRAVDGEVPLINPYVSYTGTERIKVSECRYSGSIVDRGAATDLAQVYERYFHWDWPAGL